MSAARSAQIAAVLRIISVGAVVVALFALLWRPSLDAELPDEAAGALPADSAQGIPSLPAARAGDAQRIIANNLFAASRQAPARRYAPATDVAAPDAASDPVAVFDPGLTAETPSLLGTVIDALGTRALLQLSATDSAPKFYSRGERVGPYRVQRIEAGRVVLTGPTGRIVLELSKPNEARP